MKPHEWVDVWLRTFVTQTLVEGSFILIPVTHQKKNWGPSGLVDLKDVV